jgi:hypothetical protein
MAEEALYLMVDRKQRVVILPVTYFLQLGLTS